RYGYLIRSYRLTPDGRCPDCNAQLPGVWPAAPGEVRTGNDMAAYRGRLPRAVAAPPAERPPPVKPSHPPGGTPSMSTEESVAAQLPALSADLTPEQREQVVAAAGALLRAAVAGRPAVPPPVPEHTVAGTFVSLKRGGHLRSCCGLLGTPTPLA